MRCENCSASKADSRFSTFSDQNNGRPEAQNQQAKEARAQHAQGSARHRYPEVSAVPGNEASASRL
jgi:hypothetical protein